MANMAPSHVCYGSILPDWFIINDNDNDYSVEESVQNRYITYQGIYEYQISDLKS